MKKLLCSVSVLIILLLSCVTVSAASTGEKSDAVVIDANGTVRQMYFKKLSPDLEKSIAGKVSDSDKLGYDPKKEESHQLVLEGFLDGDTSGLVFPVKVRIDFRGVAVGTKFRVMYFIDANNYIILNAVVKDGSPFAGLSSAPYYSPSLDFMGAWLEIIFDEEVPLNGFYFFNYVEPVKSPKTGVDGFGFTAACLALLSGAALCSAVLIRKKDRAR